MVTGKSPGATTPTSPISTVGQPMVIIPPCAVLSPIRAAGLPPISTVKDPRMITSGGPTQVQISPKAAAGIPPISTVTAPGGKIGPPTCGTGITAGVTIGQTWRSPTRAAGCPIMIRVKRQSLILTAKVGKPPGNTGKVLSQRLASAAIFTKREKSRSPARWRADSTNNYARISSPNT